MKAMEMKAKQESGIGSSILWKWKFLLCISFIKGLHKNFFLLLRKRTCLVMDGRIRITSLYFHIYSYVYR